MKTPRAGFAMMVVGALAALPAEAQRARPGGAGMGPGHGMRMGGGLARQIELALEHGERLELSAEQVAALEELSDAVESAREAVRSDIEGLREQARDEEVGPRELRRQMREVRERARESHAPYRERFQELLTLKQGNELRALLARRRMRDGRRPGLRGGAPGPAGGPLLGSRMGRRGGRVFCRWEPMGPSRGMRGPSGFRGMGMMGWGPLRR